MAKNKTNLIGSPTKPSNSHYNKHVSRYFTTLALVIKKHTLKESDLLVTLLTPQHGKIVALAKGARSIKSRRLSSLQLGNTIKVQIYNKDNYRWLSESQTITSFLNDSKTLIQSNLLFYFLEILNQLIAENQQLDNIYPISQNIIKSIRNNSFNKFVKYEIDFINTLGFGLPKEITISYQSKNYRQCQQAIKSFLESIIQKPLTSNKLFN